MLLAESGPPDDLGAAYYNSPFFVRPTEHVDVSQGPPRSKGRPARRSASVECGIASKRPHRTSTQPHLLQGRDSTKLGTPSRSTTASSQSGLFAVLSALGARNPSGASGSFSAGQCAPKLRQKSLMEVMQATNKALSHFTPSESDCALSPSAGSGDISPSPPISPKVFPTRPVSFSKHSWGSCHHPPEAQRGFHISNSNISRGNSRLKMTDSSMPGSSAHSGHSDDEGHAGSNEGEDGSMEVGEPEWRANCSEGERLIGELRSERVGGERQRQTDQLEGAAVGVASGRSMALTRSGRQGEDSMDRVSGLVGSSCNAPVLKQASLRNQGPPQQLAASSAVGVEELLLGNGSVFSCPYQTSPPKTSIMDVACTSRPDNTKAAQSKPLAESNGTMGINGSSRKPAGSSAPQIDLQPPPSPERVSKTHGPPTSSNSWSNNSSSGKDSGSSTNVPFSSKLARMFSGLSNSLSKKRMGEVARGVDGSRSGSEGSSVKGGQEGLRESPVSTGDAEELQREGAAKEHQTEGIVAPSAGLQHGTPRKSLSCSTLPPLASKASHTTSSTVPSPKGPSLSRTADLAQHASNMSQQPPPAPSQTPPPFPVPCPPSEGPRSAGSLRSHQSLHPWPPGEAPSNGSLHPHTSLPPNSGHNSGQNSGQNSGRFQGYNSESLLQRHQSSGNLAQGYQSNGRPRPRPSSSLGVAVAASHSNANCTSLPLPMPLMQQQLQQHLSAGAAGGSTLGAPASSVPLSTDNLHHLSLQVQQQRRKPAPRRTSTVGTLGYHNSLVSPSSYSRPPLHSSPLSSSSLRPSSGLHSRQLMRVGPSSTDALNTSVPSNSKGELASGGPPGGSPPSYPWMKDDASPSPFKSGPAQGCSPPVSNSFLNPVASELLRTRLSERDAARVQRRKEMQARDAWKHHGPLSS